MNLNDLTRVPTAALPLAVFKEHLRLGAGFDDDGGQDRILETYLRAAQSAIEARTGKVLLDREMRWDVTAWRARMRQPLPVAPVSAIVRMTRVSGDGQRQEVAPTRYRLEPDSQRPAVVPVGAALPDVPRDGRIEVVMLAGYGPDWSDLPDDLAQAVLLLAAHFYEFRTMSGDTGHGLPQGVAALIERYRTVRLFMGGRS
ncbi:hypothetical protein EU805_06535 [Salipiger sp. IMCC34102]|uniref:head-tail connector protein n=1 Tax=Salipiger sp. IMCC34102 TaxID=2510647 RepID=UPI00101D15B2|nr:head-tail connector protein [Salipiger sp. IMCC34102]RYH03376.1 hypothetical protein EU805_06535 [Salipiger sp. IMCC34102]